MSAWRKLLTAGVVGSAWLWGACGGTTDFGRSAQAPLGTVPMMDAVLIGKGLEKEQRGHDLVAIFGEALPAGVAVEGGTRWTYRDRARAGDESVVSLYLDGKGQLVAVGGNFRSDSRDFELGVYKVGRFIGEYWGEHTRRAPTFGPAPSSDGLVGREMLVATFEANGCVGRWVKHVMDTEVGDKIVDEVLVRLR